MADPAGAVTHLLHFAYPLWLFGLLVVPLVALVLLQHVSRERRDLEDYAQRGALVKMGLAPTGHRNVWRGGLVVVAIACGLLALAQPRWGGNATQSGVTVGEGSLVVVLDISRSMLAQDMGGESRLAGAQRSLERLLPSLAGWRVGVVGFAGEGQALVPLTTDHAAIDTMLQKAVPGQVSGKGTNLEAGLKAALPLFINAGRRVAVIMSDGEELSGDASRMAQPFKDAHIEIDAIGLGTPDGAFIPGPADVWGNPTYLTYRGDKVTSRLNEGPLKHLASETGGFYIRAVEGGAADLGARLGGSAQTSVTTDAKSDQAGHELFQLPLALAFALLLLEAALGLLAGLQLSDRRFAAELAKALRRPAVAMLLVGIVCTQGGWTWYPSWLPNREAGQAFGAGDFPRAAKLLDGALKHDPTNFGLQYNRANVSYEQQHYQEAIGAYRRALAAAEPGAKPVISYNLGNAYFRQAETSGDQAGYKRAIEEYQRALKGAPTDADATYNLSVAQSRLKQPKKPPSAPKQGQNGNQGSKGNQGGNAGQAQTGAGANPTYHPPAAPRNLPSEGEVDALLKALESDERQRQAEQAQERPEESNGGPFTQQLLNQALGSLDLQKDW